jgi:signal transduction histidine kinase
MLTMALIPLLTQGVYAVAQIKRVSLFATAESKNQLRESVLRLQEASLASRAECVELELQRIENSVKLLQMVTLNLFEYPESLNPHPYVGRRKLTYVSWGGFYWTPIQPLSPKISTVFVSSRTRLTQSLLREIAYTQHLDPVFAHILDTNPHIVAAYFITTDSISRIYPQLDFPDLIRRKKLPANMRAQDYPFFYMGDPEHNPRRQVVWTNPYFDVTDRGWMVTCMAPVYLRGEKFRGVVAVDVTLENFRRNILGLPFGQPGTYAFLMNERGNFVALPEEARKDLGLSKTASLDRMTLKALPSPAREVFHSLFIEKKGLKLTDLATEKKYFVYTTLPSHPWVLGYVISEGAIGAQVDAITRSMINREVGVILARMAFGLLFTMVAVAVGSMWFSRRLTLPLKALTKSAKALAELREEEVVPPRGEDELAVLASTFNRMATRIKSLISTLQEEGARQAELNRELQLLNKNLEEKVEQRTRELKYTNDCLRAANRRLWALENSRRKLFENLTHDLKTPLTSIRGYLEALLDEIAGTEEQRKNYLNIAYQRVLQLDRLLNDMLLLSRLEARQEFKFTKVSATSFLKKWVNNIWDDVVSSNRRLSVCIPDNLPTIQIDTAHLQRALQNIVDNALKYTRAGGQIIISADRLEDKVTITIVDDGLGISPQDLPFVFERFYKGSGRNRSSEGSGLGLAITKEIIEAHGGSVRIESDLGLGTKVIVQLPCQSS